MEIWNGSKFSKWRMIYYDHKHIYHILSLLHYNRHISSLTIRNHIDSNHCFTIWIKPSETFRNETKCPNHSPLPGRFGNENTTHPVLARLLYIGGWSYLNIQFFWGCGTISFLDDVQNLWMLSTKTQQDNWWKWCASFLVSTSCGRLHMFHGTSDRNQVNVPPLCQKSLKSSLIGLGLPILKTKRQQ